MNKAVKMRVTVSTIEEQDGEDYAIKVKVSEERLPDNPKKLADSTMDYYMVGKTTWLEEHRKRARQNAGQGLIKTYTYEYWLPYGDDTPIPIPIPEPRTPPTVERPPFTPPEGDAPLPPADEDLNLAELRAKYPKIKATSIAKFLDKVSHLPKNKK